ncbi:MAG: HEAT repeat domain-containing protein [Methanomicrobiales archaeon]|nr:HEAT repeat domain-containing protein [Methanomicrobiales archaeon]
MGMQERMGDLVARLKHCRSLGEIQEACSTLGKETDVVPLLTGVLGSEETSVRWKAAVALTGMGVPAVEKMIGCLSDPRAFVRSSAAWVLGNIGDRRAVSRLRKSLEDPSPDVRKEASEALGKLMKGGESQKEGNGTRAGPVPFS